MTEPPIKLIYHGRFHTGLDAPAGGPPRRAYHRAARQVAFAALTGCRPTAQLVHATVVSSPGEGQVVGGWVIADPAGVVTALRGQHPGGRWSLADTIVPGSSGAVQRPALNGHLRDRPDAYREIVERHESALRGLQEAHAKAVTAGRIFAELTVHPAPAFLGLLRAAVKDRGAQLVLHDWLAERAFPHAEELRSKKWDQGQWTANQLLDLLTKPFASTRRSFRGRTV